MENMTVWIPALTAIMPVVTAVLIWLLGRSKTEAEVGFSRSGTLERLTEIQTSQHGQILQLSDELLQEQKKVRQGNKEIANLHNIIADLETVAAVERGRADRLQTKLDAVGGTEVSAND